MTTRALAVSGALSVLLLSGCGSGPPKDACNATTCGSGCCDAMGECQPGFAAQACGSSGLTCMMCLEGTTCQA